MADPVLNEDDEELSEIHVDRTKKHNDEEELINADKASSLIEHVQEYIDDAAA